jgi:hypothetical protein
MIYLKINRDELIKYPYTLSEFRNENTNTSFPQIISAELLNEYNVHIVYPVGKGNDYTKNYTEGTPQLIDGQYYQNWIVTDATQEEIDQRIDSQWSQVRSIRNQYLSECDWTQLPDSPLTEEKKGEWVVYRQELRDVTLEEDPFNIIWPVKPQ